MARKTPLRKPNRGKGIVSIKPRPKSVYNFFGLVCCFIVLLCVCLNLGLEGYVSALVSNPLVLASIS